jgi:hypothetical protein
MVAVRVWSTSLSSEPVDLSRPLVLALQLGLKDYAPLQVYLLLYPDCPYLVRCYTLR